MESNTKTDEILNLLEISLKTNKWAAGDKPTSADRLALENLAYAPNPDAHPFTFAWWAIADRYTPAVKKTWPDAPAGCKILAKAQEKVAQSKSTPKKAVRFELVEGQKQDSGDDSVIFMYCHD